MSDSNWKDLLSPRCLYVYSNDTETIRSEELVRAVDGVVEAISVPDPADQRGGNRVLVLLKNEENKKHLENYGIIYQGRHLNVESSNNTCDIPNAWERFVDGAFQQPMQYPSGQQSAQENDVYANTPGVQNMPMPSPQHYMGQQMAATPGQQNPMNPGHYPFNMHPFYMQGMPPNMYPQEGAVGQNVPPEAGNFPNPQQLWLQQMQHMQQMFYQMHGRMPGTEGSTAAQPPPYTPVEEKSSSLPESLESTATKSKQSYSDLQSSDGESVTPSAPDEEVQEADESEQETSKSEAAMIKVTNIPDGTSKDALLFFFENRRKSGGGSVEDLEYDPDTKSAVITFEEPEAVKRVLGKLPILYNGVQIGVEEFRPDVRVEDYSEEAGEDSENILEVRGVSSKTSEDTVMMYFENTRRSGGGEIKSMKEDDGVFYIRFEDDQAIEKVLKKHHKIDGTAIKVCRYVPPPPPKPVPMYSNKVFIKNISEKTTKDGLENFLEAKSNITPVSIEYGELEGTALITFEEDIDFEKLQLACRKRTLDKSHLEISRVPITNCAIVRNISERTSRDTLEFYFDNEKRSGVRGVLDVKMLDGFCLVYFEEPEAVDVVCRRPHRIDEQDLDVKIYYECLGQVESDDEPFKTPTSLEISDFDPKKLQFLIKSPPNQQAVEKQLEAVYGKPIWPKKSKSNSLTVECTLTPETKDCRKIARHWETKVKENLSKFLDLLHVCRLTTLQEAFPLVLSELKSLTISNPDAVAVVLEKSNHEIYVTGHKQAVTDVSKQVSDIIKKVDQELDRKKQQVQEEKELKRHLVLMLQFCKFEQELQKKYKDISLKYDISKNLVKFEGLSGEVTNAKVEMYEFLSKVVKTEVKQFSKLLQHFLQQQPVYMYVNSKMKERNIIGIWEFRKGEETLTVFSMSDQQAVQAAHLIKESVIETPIKLENESKALLPTREWQSKVEEIENNGQGLIKIIAQADQGRIIILCTDQWEGLAREYIDDFMSANTIYEESLNLESAMMKYLQMNCAGDLDDVSRSRESEKVKVEVRDSGIVIKATKTGLNQAKFAIDKIVQGVKKQTHSINKAGIRKHMESSAGQEKLKKVERSEGVVIQVSDESASDEDTSSSWLTTGAKRQELAVCVTKEGKKISAMVVDMLELDVDVIVNPANKDMKHIGGIAKFIVEKGGRSIQDECNDYVRRKGRLMEGQVYLSAAGDLKCKGVIHAVGPVWQNGTNQEEEYLREAVIKSLEVTSDKRLTSIAFPALCTGVFGYPVREATRVIVVAVRDFFKENFGSPVEAVYLCDVKEDNVNGFVTAMKRELKDVTVKAPEHGSQWKSGKTPVPAARKTVKAVPVAAGNITIHIVKGQISKQKVDVVVNTTSKDLKLGNGAVSASLLKAGGPVLQQECDQNYPQGIQHGDIAVTSGGNLYCQSICHGSLPGWDQQGAALKVLRAFMEKCLAHVDQNQHSSVAFPAMGTGNLGYPRETVAKEMFSIVYNFGSNNPSTTISDVYFVLYDRDTETVKAFETEERRQRGGGGGGRHGRQLGPRSQNPSSGQSSDRGASAQGGSYGNSSNSDLSDSDEIVIDFENLEFRVYQGDITIASVDVIVNSTNPEFDLKRGLVSKIILKKEGSRLEQEVQLNKEKLKSEGMAITTASKLNCRFILHLDSETKSRNWEEKITKCLLLVENSNHGQSMAFPLLGQAFGLSPEKLAKHFFKAIINVQDKVTNLKQVHVVIFDSGSRAKFLDSFKECCQSYTPKSQGYFKKLSNLFGYGKLIPLNINENTVYGGIVDKNITRKSNTAVDIWGKARKAVRTVESMNSVTLIIYGKDSSKIKNAIQSIEDGMQDVFKTKVYNESIIKTFSSSQNSDIGKLQNDLGVEVKVETRLGRITIQGLIEDVMSASDKINDMIRKADAIQQEKQSAEMIASMVEWCFLDTGSVPPKLEKYPSHINLKLEKALRNQESSTSFKDSDGNEYIVDLTTYEEYPEGDRKDVVKVIRRSKIDGSSFEQPPTWTTMAQNENVAVVTLIQNSPEFQGVQQDFIQSTGRTYTIVKIERIQNRMLLQQYEAKLKLLEKQNAANTTNEKKLWHGTGNDAVASINTYGFNRSYCGKNAVVHGNGVYFAINAAYSARDTYSPRDYNNYKRVYRCRVLTGEYCQGAQGMKVPPSKPGAASTHILYDSVVDNKGNPGIFVIFNDTQAYPEYLITFQ